VSASTCLSCNSGYGTVLVGTSCACPAGKYPNASSVCVNCDVRCLTCDSNGSSACLSCPAGSHRTYQPASKSCPCDAAYYDAGGTNCLPCASPCAACLSGSTLNCTSCLAGYRLVGSSCTLVVSCPFSYYYQGYCLAACPNSTYPSGGSCLPCSGYCATCSSAANCTSCLSPY
jgi:hypothetical protein